MEIKVHHINPAGKWDARAQKLVPAMGGFPHADLPLFLSAYSELCRVDLSGMKVMEICGGVGKLAAGLAGIFSDARIIGLDLYVPEGKEVEDVLEKSPGLSYHAGNAFDLKEFESESMDLIFGQAALHHLAHDLKGLRNELLRVLKPGGRLVFIFEPLGHNPLISAIRAARFARAELPDESNLYFSQFEELSKGFSSCEIQVYNFLGYPMKAMTARFGGLTRLVHQIDHWMLSKSDSLLKHCANCNLVLVK